MKKEILTIKKLFFEFKKDNEILSDISFELAEGEILGILGPSGIGKSSLLRLIAGLEKPKSGEILYYGQILSNKDIFIQPHQRGIGFVFQEKVLFPHLNSLENVKFGVKGNKIEKEAQAKKYLGLLKAEKFEQSYPNSLSGGEQQRVAIARALAPEPKTVLLDEPFSSLDIDLRKDLRNDAKDLFKKTNTSCIIVTHELEEARVFCDRILRLEKGLIKEVTI
tara:strand:+ start:2072 stop:2737 length:666 start_codon:yes stop_codon:yes gene_type:complete